MEERDDGTRIAARYTWERAVLDSDLESTAKLIALALATYMAPSQPTAFPSKATLAADCSISEATLKRHMKTLVSRGWIRRRVRRAETGRQRSNLYEARIPGETTALLLAARGEGGQNEPPGSERPGGGGSERPPPRGVKMNPHKLPDEQTTRTRWTLDGPYSPEFEEAWKARVRRDGNDPKRAGWKAWVRTIRAGADPELLARRIREYRAWCEDRGHAGTERAMRFSTFLGPDAPWEQDWAVKLRLDRLDSEQRRRERALRHGRDPDAPPELFDPPEPTRRPAEGQAAEDAREFLERFERARSEREPDDDDPGGDEEESDGDPTARRPAGGGA